MWLTARAYTLPFVNWWPPSFSVTRVFHAGLLHEAKKLANFPALKPQIFPGSLQTNSGRGNSFRYLIFQSCHSMVQKIFNVMCSDKYVHIMIYYWFQSESWCEMMDLYIWNFSWFCSNKNILKVANLCSSHDLWFVRWLKLMVYIEHTILKIERQ